MVAVNENLRAGESRNEGGAEQDPRSMACAESLVWLCTRLTEFLTTGKPLASHERRQLAASVHLSPTPEGLRRGLVGIYRRMGFEESGWFDAPSESELPMVAIVPDSGYRLVCGKGVDGAWVAEGPNGRQRFSDWPQGTVFAAAHSRSSVDVAKTARAFFVKAFREEPGWIAYAVLASLLASMLALATSLYSMQVYDRVIGSGAMATLLVLTAGVGLSILIEFAVKLARSAIVDRATGEVDHACAHGVFSRLLAVRFDQRPASVGTLASQVRSYESIRSFAMALVLFLTADGPFALFFLGVIFLIAGPVVTAVPLAFIAVSVAVGLMFKRRIQTAAVAQAASGNRRHGLLVEAIEGGESIKANGTGWRVLGKWNELSRQNVSETMEIKHLNDLSSYLAASLQQISYVGLVAAGAWVAINSSELTTGGIIACSILSGRVLSPVGMVPGLLVQWAHAKAALEHLEQLFKLESDNHSVASPLYPDAFGGNVECTDVKFVYPGQVTALSLPKLSIRAGEKVAVLGSIGAGKSTFLRILAGLTKPQRGRVLFDGLDIQQVAAERRAELIGYLPQQVALFGGSLRENLLAGLPPLSEQELLGACQATGLAGMIATRSEGLDLLLNEGGSGLSGGQKQLVAVTRLILSSPNVWILDEPTAAMDEATEGRCLHALREAIRPEHTLVVVTHKAQLLALVDRIIVLTPDGIALDGPRDAVLARLRQPVQRPGPAAAVVAEGGAR